LEPKGRAAEERTLEKILEFQLPYKNIEQIEIVEIPLKIDSKPMPRLVKCLMMITKDNQIYFYHSNQHIFFYQVKEPIISAKIGKMKFGIHRDPEYCLSIICENGCIAIFCGILLYEYQKHEILRKEIEKIIRARCDKIIYENKGNISECVKNCIYNTTHNKNN